MRPTCFRTPTTSTRILIALAMAALWLPGCESYQMRGYVVEGPASMVLIADADDSRLQMPGVPGATLEFMLDPTSLGRKPMGATFTGKDGAFNVPVDEFGAGFLEYELGVICRRKGYEPAIGNVIMPNHDQRLLVVLNPGRDVYKEKPDVMEDTQRFLDSME